MDFEYWYVFPYAILVATLCNASGFSGAVLFQPFFYFVLQTPIPQSIATGIATETIGMTSGTVRYAFMRRHDLKNYLYFIPWVLAGTLMGILLFTQLPVLMLRALVGSVMILVAITHFVSQRKAKSGTRAWSKWLLAPLSLVSGIFSATTGTGVAELTQPMSEHGRKMPTKTANANAIMLEATANWVITIANLSLGNIRWDILVFSASGVLIGGQVGAHISTYVPDKILRTVFCVCIALIGCFYIWTFAKS